MVFEWKFRDVSIPSFVLDMVFRTKEMTRAELGLYIVIKASSSYSTHCTLTNKSLAATLKTDVANIRRQLKRLEALGLVINHSHERKVRTEQNGLTVANDISTMTGGNFALRTGGNFAPQKETPKGVSNKGKAPRGGQAGFGGNKKDEIDELVLSLRRQLSLSPETLKNSSIRTHLVKAKCTVPFMEWLLHNIPSKVKTFSHLKRILPSLQEDFDAANDNDWDPKWLERFPFLDGLSGVDLYFKKTTLNASKAATAIELLQNEDHFQTEQEIDWAGRFKRLFTTETFAEWYTARIEDVFHSKWMQRVRKAHLAAFSVAGKITRSNLYPSLGYLQRLDPKLHRRLVNDVDTTIKSEKISG